MELAAAFNGIPPRVFEFVRSVGSRRIQSTDVYMVSHFYTRNDRWIIVTIQKPEVSIIENHEIDSKILNRLARLNLLKRVDDLKKT